MSNQPEPRDPYTKLKGGERVLRYGFCGLGAGSRGKTFAPGHLYLTDRRLIIESRVETDRTIVTIALAAVTLVDRLPDGVELTIEKRGETHHETIIIWGEAGPWVNAIETARRAAPSMKTAITEGRQRTRTEKRRRTVALGAAWAVGGVLLALALCIMVVSIWFAIRGGSP